MWGMIAKITTVQGARDLMVSILQRSTAGLPGCLTYVVGKDMAEENVLWVTEAWESQANHDASLYLPQVQNAIPQAKPIVAGFEKIAAFEPVLGIQR
jgi:quinol monooxygenase YgiN